MELLERTDLPEGFTYPREFIRIIELGLSNLEPWQVMSGYFLVERSRGLRERYPDRILVPFARRQDNDDVACWDLKLGEERVAIVHDFASPGWERRAEFAGFNDWLRQAIEDLIEFGC